jgi:hypothetical protein
MWFLPSSVGFWGRRFVTCSSAGAIRAWSAAGHHPKDMELHGRTTFLSRHKPSVRLRPYPANGNKLTVYMNHPGARA